jgi:excisionase family DNA binding protein
VSAQANGTSGVTGQLLTAAQVAERFQVTEAQVYRLTRDGLLPAVELGRYYRYRLDVLEAAGLGELRAKANPIVFHDLRHTFGTQCAARNIDLRRIQAWMGHADIQTTQRYLHYVPQHDDAARLTLAFTAETVHPAVHRTGAIAALLSDTEHPRCGCLEPNEGALLVL